MRRKKDPRGGVNADPTGPVTIDRDLEKINAARFAEIADANDRATNPLRIAAEELGCTVKDLEDARKSGANTAKSQLMLQIGSFAMATKAQRQTMMLLNTVDIAIEKLQKSIKATRADSVKFTELVSKLSALITTITSIPKRVATPPKVLANNSNGNGKRGTNLAVLAQSEDADDE